MILKVASVMSALRAFLDGNTTPVLQCHDDDFSYAFSLVTKSYEQFQDLYPLLPSERYGAIQLNEIEKSLLKALPDLFSTEEAYKEGLRLGRAERSVRDVLRKLKLLGVIERQKVGEYKKVD